MHSFWHILCRRETPYVVDTLEENREDTNTQTGQSEAKQIMADVRKHARLGYTNVTSQNVKLYFWVLFNTFHFWWVIRLEWWCPHGVIHKGPRMSCGSLGPSEQGTSGRCVFFCFPTGLWTTPWWTRLWVQQCEHPARFVEPYKAASNGAMSEYVYKE